MHKKVAAMFLTGALIFLIAACGGSAESDETASGKEAGTEAGVEKNEPAEDEAQAEGEESNDLGSSFTLGEVDNTLAEDTDALVSAYADRFEQIEYKDQETGLGVTYNLFLPVDYNENEKYPTVIFIADSSCVGDDATASLTQGRGALVWASDAWQSVNPSIVVVPSYPETILDDHNGYTTTEYVELTKRLIDAVSEEYAVDTNRIYGTGQSMGCMATLILASEYPDLYAACMFVDGQWDVNTLSGLEGQHFIYFAAEDDTNAYNGMQEVMGMFDEDAVSYTYEKWDGTDSVDELSESAEALFEKETAANFISWASGTIEPKSGMGGSGGTMAGSKDLDGTDKEGGFSTHKELRGDAKEDQGDLGDADSESHTGDRSMGETNGMSGRPGEGDNGANDMNSTQYHMASFDYAYNCIAVMEWMFQQEQS